MTMNRTELMNSAFDAVRRLTACHAMQMAIVMKSATITTASTTDSTANRPPNSLRACW